LSACPIRLLAIDIDGTLLDTQGQLPERNRDALAAAQQAGVEIVLVTGRRYSFALPIARMLPFDTVLISSNGAVIRSAGGHTYHRQLLSIETAARALELARDWRDYTLLAYDTETNAQLVLEGLQRRTPGFLAWLERNRQFVAFAPVDQALRERAPEQPLQIMFSGPVAELRRIERLLLESELAASFRVMKTEYEDRDLSIVDIVHPECSKGNALKTWAGLRGYRREEVMAVGDNFNDFEMLQFAGLAVVMGNCVDGLRGDGWHSTGHCDDAGLAEAIHRWLLAGQERGC